MKNTVFKICFVFCFLILNSVLAENCLDSANTKAPQISLSGFLDVYYAYDFNRPTTDYRQTFLYNHNRHNEFNLNLGYIKLNAVHAKYRANIALQAGTYANDNYAAESNLLKHVFEANAGVAINKKNNLWLDAGVFASHIGFESAVSSDNFTLTRSLLAENSPYYLSGAKITYEPNHNFDFALIVCNGWQRIRRVSGNSLPAFGTHINYIANDKISFVWSSFVGTDDPDSLRRMRYFNDLFAKFQVTKKLSLITGCDIGFQQKARFSSDYNSWFTPIVIAKYAVSSKYSVSVRGEYFNDKNGVIIGTGTPNGFQTSGASINFDYAPTNKIMCRIEARGFNSKDAIFTKQNSTVNTNAFVIGSIAIKLE